MLPKFLEAALSLFVGHNTGFGPGKEYTRADEAADVGRKLRKPRYSIRGHPQDDRTRTFQGAPHCIEGRPLARLQISAGK